MNAWKDSGIRDSKNISSDKRIRELAELIRNTPGCVTTVVPDWQRGLQPSLRQVPQRQHHARLGSCAGDREPDGTKTPHVTAPGARHQRPVRLEQRHRGRALMTLGREHRVGPETPRRGRPGRGGRLDSGAPRICQRAWGPREAIRDGVSQRRLRSRGRRRAVSLSPNTAPKTCPKWPKCTSAPPCAPRACPSRPRPSGARAASNRPDWGVKKNSQTH